MVKDKRPEYEASWQSGATRASAMKAVVATDSAVKSGFANLSSVVMSEGAPALKPLKDAPEKALSKLMNHDVRLKGKNGKA